MNDKTERHCGNEKYCRGFCTAGTWSDYCNGFWCKNEFDTRIHPTTAAAKEPKFCTNMGKLCGYWNGTECIHGNGEEPDCFSWLEEHDVKVREGVITTILNGADAVWNRMSHGSTSHHHKIKREVFLRFRKMVESSADPEIGKKMAGVK